MTKPKSEVIDILSILESNDPLSDEACNFLLNYNEEDTRVDYKESFSPEIGKSWIDLAIDVSAFANTHGGYLVFGIQDKTYKKVGLKNRTYEVLTDTKTLIEKIDRNIQPKFTSVRTKGKTIDEKLFVFLFVPPTQSKTHVFEENLEFKNPDGGKIIRVQKGSVFVRKSGSNQILTSDAFEEIIDRRIERYKKKLLDGLTRVVHSEPDQEVVLVTEANINSDGQKSFKVDNAPESIKEIIGRNFSMIPETLEEKVALWITSNEADRKNFPTESGLMETYSQRYNINLNTDQKLKLAYFSMIQSLPTFFWLKGVQSSRRITSCIEESFNNATHINKIHIAKVSGFYNQSLYKRLQTLFGENAQSSGIKNFKNVSELFKTEAIRNDKKSEDKATEIAKQISNQHDMAKIYKLIELDCGLYAPFK